MYRYSKAMLLACGLSLLLSNLAYYPKWKKTRTEATLSWDVSGYYFYLPAIFIYKDLKQLEFKDEILKKYYPTPNLMQAYQYHNGNYILKYPVGQAIQFAPFFLIAHAYASWDSIYPADGFSLPYQFMISMGSLVIAFIGLWFMRLSLLRYISDRTTALTLFCMVIGSNYLNYAGIDGAMTHNNLFTLYAILIYCSIKFYDKASMKYALAIGAISGLAMITRPTEILSIIIPIFWGTNIFSPKQFRQRLQFLLKHWAKIIASIALSILVGSIQLIYWKYVSGEWFVYSYQDQGFSWLQPHLLDGLLSYKSGWLTYSPMMIFSLIGFYFLYKSNRAIFPATFIFTAIFIYVAFAWDIWWYGGSLGQRTMVQCYPILMFPLAAFISRMNDFKRHLQIVILLVMVIFSYLNLWFTHNAHLGRALFVAQMTKSYYWKSLGRLHVPQEHYKLLDTDELYEGRRKNISVIDTNAGGLIKLSKAGIQNAEKSIDIRNTAFDWLRVDFDYTIPQKEWTMWKMTQLMVQFLDNDTVVKSRFIRIHRHRKSNQRESLFFDVEKPKQSFDQILIKFDNLDSDKDIYLDNIKVEVFDEG